MNRTRTQSFNINQVTHKLGNSRGKIFGLLIVGALLAFELFNYSTTDFALNDLLGGLRFLGVRWATILAIAFCGIDFAGIARLFTPEQGRHEQKEVWYLLCAWLLAASMNAMLTWWGVALAIVNHESLGGSVIDRETLIEFVPVFVAIMVWLIRVLIIGTFSVAGNRLYSQAASSHNVHPAHASDVIEPSIRSPQPQPVNFHPLPKSVPQADRRPFTHNDPTYHPAGMAGYNPSDNQPRQ